MILSDQDIREAAKGVWNIEGAVDEWAPLIAPFVSENVQPASVDLTLGEHFIRAGEEWFTDDWDMLPGEFLLGTTVEKVNIPAHLVAQINGKSSWARKGLIVHTTAGFIDPGFYGQVTLELKNVGHEPVRITPGDRICQIVFTKLSSPAERPYGSEGLGSHYQNQQGTTKSAL